MGFQFISEKNIDITFIPQYKKAVFAPFHVGFVDNNNMTFLSSDDKSSLEAALGFYYQRILTRENYPVFDGTKFNPTKSDSDEVLLQVLGIPRAIFNHLNLSREILPQLPFAYNTDKLKRQVYSRFYSQTGIKWYRDDFKLFCLKQGFFFLYDETKPFVKNEENEVPVFIDEKRLDTRILLPLYQQAKSDRFCIDLLADDLNEAFVSEMRKYDGFSFDQRLDYFVNHQDNPDISKVESTKSFAVRYARILREYLASMINVLYDLYSFTILNKVTKKMSYMSQSCVDLYSKLYVLSSYNGEIYSHDRHTWLFSLDDKKRITNLSEKILKQYPKSSALSFYSRLGYPFEGYAFIRNLSLPLTVSKVIASLPFEANAVSVSHFSAPKRFDKFYSYLTGEKEHRYVFLRRRLQNQGIIYNVDDPFNLDLDSSIDVRSLPVPREEELRALFDDEPMSIADTYLISYTMDRNNSDSENLTEVITSLDDAYQMKLGQAFFSKLKNSSVRSAVNELLSDVYKLEFKSKQLYDFFKYLLFVPFRIALNQYRLSTLKENDGETLIAIDGYSSTIESYEPNLPYPYVTAGAICYSYRRSLLETPHVCSCQKDAIEDRIRHYALAFDKLEKDPTKKPAKADTEKNIFILKKLGLPCDVTRRINPAKDILPQISFHDNICHLCLDSEPTNFETIDSDLAAPYNVFMTYIRCQASRNGLYFNRLLSDDQTLGAVFNPQADEGTPAIFDYDEKLVNPILLPYLGTDTLTLVSLIATFFPAETLYTYFMNQLKTFLDLGEEKIGGILRNCKSDDYATMGRSATIFAMVLYIYKMVERAYAVEVSKTLIPSLEDCQFTLNHDYNSHLPYPYVVLGRIFNAYKTSAESQEYFFCECDRSSILRFIHFFYDVLSRQSVRKDIITPVVLALTGLPYEIVRKYADFDFSVGSCEDLVGKMLFRDSICQRCSNNKHGALKIPFVKSFTQKDDQEAELIFAQNAMAHEGLMIITTYDFTSILFEPNHRFDLESNNDSKLPSIYSVSDDPGLSAYTFFMMDKDALGKHINNFAEANAEKTEAFATACGTILDAFTLHKDVFYNFFFVYDDSEVYRQQINTLFSGIKSVRKGIRDEVRQVILNFLSFLLTEFVYHYSGKERRTSL